MPTTRSAARGSAASSPSPPKKVNAGTKRKAESSPAQSSKRGKKATKKEPAQKTIDDTMDIDKPEDKPKREGPDPHDTIVDSDEDEAKAEEKARKAEKEEKKAETNGHANGDAKGEQDETKTTTNSEPEPEKPSVDEEKEMIKATEEAEKKAENTEENSEAKTTDSAADKGDSKVSDATADKSTAKTADTSADKSETETDGKAEEAPDTSKPAMNGNTEQVNAAVEKSLEKAEPEKAVEQDSSRAQAEPSNILEKGIIYFFLRGRVGLDDPASIDEMQRTYMILRPIPSGGKLAGSAPIGDAGKNRMIALPKKVFPKSRRDTFLCIVESADSSFEAIRNEHLKHSDYATKTQGTRHTPAAKPIAEGIYALTTTGRESHLSYIITVPGELGQVQRDIGLSSRGAFITSVKNPDTGAPAGSAPPQKADYPEGIKKDFRGLRWGRLEPAHLDFVDTQFLLIGEGEEDKLEKSVQADKGDGQEDGKEEPKEEMELLEKEDRERIKGLSGDDSDAIFKDLGLSSDEYSKIQTTWE